MNFFKHTHSLQSSSVKKQSLLNKGFTLIELLVVIAIFTIITSIILFNQGKLNNNILVTNLAYEIALTIRQAQAYGIGVRAVDTSQGFEGGVGVSLDARTPDQLILFNDKNDNHLVDIGEELSRYTIQNQRGNTITAHCIALAANTPCTAAGSTGLINIVFKRPNPEAIFRKGIINGSTVVSGSSDDNLSSPVYIVVNTPSGDNCRVVAIEQTGEIRVENSTSGHCSNANNNN